MEAVGTAQAVPAAHLGDDKTTSLGDFRKAPNSWIMRSGRSVPDRFVLPQHNSGNPVAGSETLRRGVTPRTRC